MAEKNVSAISTLMTRLKLEPNNPEAHFNLAVAYEEAGNYAYATNEYNKALDLNKNYSRVLLHLGFIEIKKRENGKALELWGKALKADPKLVELFRTEPTAAYYKNKIDSVIAIFQKNIASNPKVAKGHYELGLVYKYFNKLELALQCFKTATDLDSVMWEAYVECGETYSALGQTKMAIEQMKYAILANPGNKNPIVYIALADVYIKENMMGYAQQQLNKAIDLDPKSSEAYLLMGKLFFRLSNFKMAMKNYQKAIEVNPNNADAHYQLAKTCQAMYRPDFAIIELEKAVASKPDFAEAYYDWGTLLLQMGDVEKAIPKLEYVLKINPNDAYTHYTLGTAYLKIEDYNTAKHHFKASTQINKTDAYTFYNLGICCINTKDNQGALNAFKQAMDLAPSDSQYAYQRYLVNMNIMDFEEAEKDIKKAIKAKPAEVDYRLKLVALYKRKKQYSNILDELNNYININPKVSSIYSEMGIAYSELGDTSVAKVSFEKALSLNPNDVRAIYGKGELLKASGIKLREAKEMFKRALEIDPKFLPALEDLGLMYFEEGDPDTGTKYFRSALDSASAEELNGVKVNYAGVLIKYGQADEGVKVFKNLINERPEDARLRMSLAKAYKEIERYDDAISQLQIAQEIEPENPDYPMELGEIFTELGLIDEARDTYYTIINMYPNNKEAQKALTQLLNKVASPNVQAKPQETISKPITPVETISSSDRLKLSKEEKISSHTSSMSMPDSELDLGNIESEEKQKPVPVNDSISDSLLDFDFTEEDLGLVDDDDFDIDNLEEKVKEEKEEEKELLEIPDFGIPHLEETNDSHTETDLMSNFGDLNFEDLDIALDTNISEENITNPPATSSAVEEEKTDKLLTEEPQKIESDIFPVKSEEKTKKEEKVDSVFSSNEDDLFSGLDDIFGDSSSTAKKEEKKSNVDDIFAEDSTDDIFGDSSSTAKKEEKKSNVDDIFAEDSTDDIFGDSLSTTKKEEKKSNVDDIFAEDSLDDIFGDSSSTTKKEEKKSNVDDIFAEDLFANSANKNDTIELAKVEEPIQKIENSFVKKETEPQKSSSDLLNLDDELDNLFDEDLADTEVEKYNQEDISIDDIEEDISIDDIDDIDEEAKELQDSKQQLSAVIAAQPNDIPSRESLIDVCLRLKDYEEAYENQKYLINKAPADYKKYAQIIDIYTKANKTDELPIVEEYMSSATPDSKYIEEICNKYNEAGASSIAINECRRCSKAEPNNVDLSLLLGKMYTNAGNHALATLQYQKVIRKSHNVKINLLLADAYEHMNNLKGATKTLNKYLEAEPKDTNIWYKFMMIADEDTANEHKESFKAAIAENPLTAKQTADIKKKYGDSWI